MRARGEESQLISAIGFEPSSHIKFLYHFTITFMVIRHDLRDGKQVEPATRIHYRLVYQRPENRVYRFPIKLSRLDDIPEPKTFEHSRTT